MGILPVLRARLRGAIAQRPRGRAVTSVAAHPLSGNPRNTQVTRERLARVAPPNAVANAP